MTRAESTEIPHDGVQMASYKDEPYIIGDYDHAKIEYMSLSDQKWHFPGNGGRNFPDRDRLFGYTPISRPDKLYILGGCCDEEDNWSTIWILKNDNWSKYGELTHGRINAMAAIYGNDVMIIGGSSFDQKS